ncbi:MAG: S8 family serine peptidase [Verrucomicrobiales bacterium]|nr:S8 family serine peptidase [Verrucomicrobiales bacterium]
MQFRTRTWFLLSLLFFAAAVFFWLYGDRYEARKKAAPKPAKVPGATNASVVPAPAPFKLLTPSTAIRRSELITTPPSPSLSNAVAAFPPDKTFPHRLRNTARPIGELTHSDAAVLLQNAFIDTASQLALPIPDHLRGGSDPGSYIIQARGPIGAAFRARLREANAEIISYIPNNAYLVRVAGPMANRRVAAPETQAVLPYEPYYKLDKQLLALAVEQKTLPDDRWLRVTVFPGTRDAAARSLGDLGSEVVAEEPSPFGPQLVVRPKSDSLAAIARLESVQSLEQVHARALMSDLTRVRVAVATNSITTSNYLQLSGNGILVNVTDKGVDAAHPDLAGRVISPDPGQPQDTEGHGTLVASLIAGSGSQSGSVSGTPPGSGTNANFRGIAPAARILALSLSYDPEANNWLTDTFLQETAAQTNYVLRGNEGAPLISNNSWSYEGVNEYDSSAARFDAAVRDALPGVPRSQPVIYVFPSGNSGDGSDTGFGGTPNSIPSPANAKNVITVGAIESLRFITNSTTATNFDGTITTNTPFLGMTDSDFEIVAFSGRGNVGIGSEGTFGRFKPDVVAPGAFIIGARSKDWNPDLALDPNDERSGVIRDLDNSLAPSYRFESGTSMAAPVVSGLLALLQEFFEQRVGSAARHTNSPALMKALLINGARSLGGNYDLQVNNTINLQGWGIPNLTNMIPDMLATQSDQNRWPVRMFDEHPTNAVATGETRAWRVELSEDAQQVPFRVTLVWTDPPGNPAVAVKLVNDLDLIVSNTVTHAVYYGNNIPAFSDFTEQSDTNAAPALDRINNVENVFLRDPGGSNLVVSVVGRRVNVNSVSDYHLATGRPQDVVQDFALVIALGDTTITNGFTAGTPIQIASSPLPERQPVAMTNGVPLLSQRVGANSSLVVSTNGVTNQWNFYVFTNTFVTNEFSALTNGTNVAFITFQPPNLSRPRGSEADIDIYVSSDSALLQLNALAVAAARTSIGRGGSELVVYTNALLDQIFYIAVKSEDQQGGEFGFVAISSNEPFDENRDGSRVLRGFPVPAIIPDGSPNLPGAVQIFAIGISPQLVQNVVVTNVLTHQNLGDLIGILDHDSISVVLNNHNFNNGDFDVFNRLFVYDDSPLGVLFGSRASDGPGSLRDFAGTLSQGVWILNMIDNAPVHTGRVEFVTLRVDPLVFGEDLAALGPEGQAFSLGPNAEACGVQEVPPGVTNMIFRVSNLSGPVDVLVRRDALPTAEIFDKAARIDPPGGDLSVSILDNPPLTAGRYFFCVHNPSASPINGRLALLFEFDVNLDTGRTLFGTNAIPVLDDATLTNAIAVSVDKQVSELEVGVRIIHPRPSDLVLHLVSPQGTRLLLAENRGGNTDQGYGSGDLASLGYAVFTDDTNRANPLLPIKFSMAPFTNALVSTNAPLLFDGFELSPVGSYQNGATVSGWTVSRGHVNVHDDFSFADVLPHSGIQFLELEATNSAPAGVVRTVSTTPGTLYLLSLALQRNTTDLAGPQALQIFYGASSADRPADHYILAASTNWQTTNIVFEASSTNTVVELNAITSSGPFIDSVQVIEVGEAASSFVMPEEPLKVFKGERALGDWRLEVSDTRFGPLPDAGATLVSWMLRLKYADPFPKSVFLTNSVIFSGTITNAQTNYFVVELCEETTVASAVLGGQFDSLTLLAGRPGFPTGNQGVDEFVPLANSVAGNDLDTNGFAFFHLDATDVHPAPLQPGGKLFFAVHNSRSGETNNFTLQVNLDFSECHGPRPIIRLRDGIAYTNGIAPVERLFDYYVYKVSPIAEKVEFELTPGNGDLGMVLKPGLPLPNLTNAAYASDGPGLTNELITLTTNSAPVPLTPGDWYIGVYNKSTNGVIYTIRATPTLNTNFNLIPLTNTVPLDFTIGAGAQLTNLFLFSATNDFYEIHFDVENATNVTGLRVAFEQLPSPSNTNALQYDVTNQEIHAVIVPSDFGRTNLLGDWYLFVLGSDTADAPFTITASGLLRSTGTNVPVPSRVEFTNNAVCISWDSQTGVQYAIQGRVEIDDNVWTEVIPIITATGPVTRQCIGLPSPFNFFQVVQLGTGGPPPPPPPPSTNAVPASISVTTNGVCVAWTATVGSTYYVQGSVDIDPIDWTNISTNTAAVTNMSVCFPLSIPFQFFAVREPGLTNQPPPPPPASTNAVPTRLSVTTNDVCVAWTAKVGSTYYVRGSADIDPPAWTNVSTNTAGVTNMSVCIPQPTPFRFFSVREAAVTNAPPVTTNQVQLAQPILLPNGALELQWQAVVGQRYEVQFATNLVPAVWTMLTNITAATDSITFRPSGPLTNSALRFYRVIRP